MIAKGGQAERQRHQDVGQIGRIDLRAVKQNRGLHVPHQAAEGHKKGEDFGAQHDSRHPAYRFRT